MQKYPKSTKPIPSPPPTIVPPSPTIDSQKFWANLPPLITMPRDVDIIGQFELDCMTPPNQERMIFVPPRKLNVFGVY
jgi:hypothetical protein